MVFKISGEDWAKMEIKSRQLFGRRCIKVLGSCGKYKLTFLEFPNYQWIETRIDEMTIVTFLKKR